MYVVDAGAHRLDQVDVSGDVVRSFGDAVRSLVKDPVAVACDGDLVYVLDRDKPRVVLFDHRGKTVARFEVPFSGAAVLTAIGGIVYIADPARRRIRVFRPNRQGVHVLAGEAAGYEGPAAALARGLDGELLLLPGGVATVLRFALEGSYVREGWLRSRAIRIDDGVHYWNRLHASVELPVDSHVQFFVATGSTSTPPPPPGPSPVPGKPWRPVPSDSIDGFLTFDGKKTQAVWIAARFHNDRHATPALSQIRIDFDQESYLPDLPAIYREGDRDDLLLRFLSLFESFLRELEGKIDALPALLDPAAARREVLPWLAGFLAQPLPEVWNEADQRRAIAGAYERYARRGTVAGLRETLSLEAGVRASIDEPLQAMGWWSLPGRSGSCRPDAAGRWIDGADSVLGWNTVLASAESQGAVVGTTAILDRSQLTTPEEFGTPLFESAAHRFTIQLYPGEMACAGKLEQVRAIIDREKPAHTAYDVCVLEPGIRVGYRARLGVDTLLGGGAVPGRLGETALVLDGPSPSRLGENSRLGVSTHL